MSRKKIIDLLKTSGKNNIDTKDLEECYTFELMIVMRKETTNEKIRERRQKVLGKKRVRKLKVFLRKEI